nr:immunoglobulin heavy chain junction region [Mus musculus]
CARWGGTTGYYAMDYW